MLRTHGDQSNGHSGQSNNGNGNQGNQGYGSQSYGSQGGQTAPPAAASPVESASQFPSDGPHPACRSGRHRSGAIGARCRILSKTLMTAIHLNEPILTGTRPLITSNSRGPKSTQNMCESLRTHGLADTIERRSAMMVVRLEVT
jgi:hypothetical protein